MDALIWRVFILLSIITLSSSFHIHSTLNTPKTLSTTTTYSTISPEVASNTFKHESFSANDPDSITIIGAGPAGLAATMRMLKLGKFGDHQANAAHEMMMRSNPTTVAGQVQHPNIKGGNVPQPKWPLHNNEADNETHPTSPPISSRLPTHLIPSPHPLLILQQARKSPCTTAFSPPSIPLTLQSGQLRPEVSSVFI